MQAFSNIGYYYRISSKEIVLRGSEIEKIFELLNYDEIIVDDISYTFIDEKLDTKIIFKYEKFKPNIDNYYWRSYDFKESMEYIFSFSISNYFYITSYKYVYLFYKNKIYKIQMKI